eukprot:1407152-Rhodomonas_salina.1
MLTRSAIPPARPLSLLPAKRFASLHRGWARREQGLRVHAVHTRGRATATLSSPLSSLLCFLFSVLSFVVCHLSCPPSPLRSFPVLCPPSSAVSAPPDAPQRSA